MKLKDYIAKLSELDGDLEIWNDDSHEYHKEHDVLSYDVGVLVDHGQQDYDDWSLYKDGELDVRRFASDGGKVGDKVIVFQAPYH